MTGLNRRRFITLFASAASMAIAAPQVLAATPKIHRSVFTDRIPQFPD